MNLRKTRTLCMEIKKKQTNILNPEFMRSRLNVRKTNRAQRQ